MIQAVGLYDELRVAPAEALRFACDRSALAGTENLVVRAARALQDGHRAASVAPNCGCAKAFP